MKRTSFVLVCATLLLFCFSAAAFAELAGTATKVEGRADILKSGQTRAIDLKTGDAVHVGDVVRTLSNGRVEITFVDQSTINLGPRGRLGINTYLFRPAEEKRTVDLNLYRGRMGFNVPKAVYAGSGSKFEMRTRTAVAGVRGTGGILLSGLISQCFVNSGLIWFGNPMGSVMVGAGQAGTSEMGSVPTVRSLRPGEYERQERLLKSGGGSQNGSGDSGLANGTSMPEGNLFGQEMLLSQQLDIPVTTVLPPSSEPQIPPPFSISGSLAPMLLSPVDSINRLRWWDSGYGEPGTAGTISGVTVSGQFTFSGLNAGLYNLSHSGNYTTAGWLSPMSGFASDDEMLYLYTGSGLFGAVGAPLNPSSGTIGPKTNSTGGEVGMIEKSGSVYWYLGRPLSGSYTPLFVNASTPAVPSGSFSFTSAGFFFDDSRLIWEAYQSLPTKPAAVMDLLLPITSVVTRVFDLSGTGSISLLDSNHNNRGAFSSFNLTGKGAETAPGTGIFDLRVSGNWSSSVPLSNLATFSGTVTIGGQTLYVNPYESRISQTGAAAAYAAIFLNYPNLSYTSDTYGIVLGKMAGETSGTITGRSFGRMCNGFILSGACP
jgi:hypothetical protein